MERNVVERLLDPEYQRKMAIGGIRLVTKFFGPEVARKEAEGYCLSAEDIEVAIGAGIREAKELMDRTRGV